MDGTSRSVLVPTGGRTSVPTHGVRWRSESGSDESERKINGMNLHERIRACTIQCNNTPHASHLNGAPRGGVNANRLMLDAVERIEISVRTQWAHTLGLRYTAAPYLLSH